MNLNSLRYIVAVYEDRSMTKAAKRLFVSQSSLSQCIRAIENDLGGLLFKRSKNSLQPTPLGEHYVYWAKHTLASDHSMRQQIYELTHANQRKLIIGISSKKNINYLRYVLPKFYERTENCKVILKEYSTRELYPLLQRGNIDFIIDDPHPEWTFYKELPILKERMVIAAPSYMHFKTVDSNGKYPVISVTELADRPFIFLTGHVRYMEYMNNIFSHSTCPPRIVLECSSPGIVYDMVSEQIGVAIISELVIQKDRRAGISFYTLSEFPLNRLTSVTYPKDRNLSDDAQLFISILKEECGKLSIN